MGKTIAANSNMSANANDRTALGKIQTQLCDQCLASAGLVIGSSSKAKVKIANTVHAFIDGVLVKKTTAEVAFTATTHDVANAKFAAFLLTLKADGTATLRKSADADTRAAIVLPTVPDGEVVIGIVIINPTGTGIFDASTTELDDGTVVPNAEYISITGPFNPNTLSL